MPKKWLPRAAVALADLRAHGDQFASVPLAPLPLKGCYYTRDDKTYPVEVDERVLKATRTVYTRDRALTRALGRKFHVRSSTEALTMLAERYSRGFVWGVSGYATPGIDSNIEADALEALYDYFASSADRRPAMVCDGGGGCGVLGINGVLAGMHGIECWGITPLAGLGHIAPRTCTLIHGITYAQREIVVALVPDALVAVGGRRGALNEMLAALEAGTPVLLIALNKRDPEGLANTWQNNPTLRGYERSGRLLVCERLDEISLFAESIRLAGRGLSPRYLRRLDDLSRLLLA